ncbi:exosortase N [Chitinophaga lutea]
MEHRLTLSAYTAIILAYAAIAVYALRQYLPWNSPVFLLGLAVIPIALRSDPQRKSDLRFYYAALAFSVLAWLIPATTFIFLAVLMGLCFVADTTLGRINLLPPLALIVAAPMSDYFFRVFTFPIRLQLTDWAAALLRWGGQPAAAEGNSIVLHGNTFSVDAACMGLGMMTTALLFGILVLGWYQHQYKKQLSFAGTAALLALIFALNTAGNLVRIILIVTFSIMPGQAMHDIAGLLCMAGYVVLPLCWLCPRIVRRWGRTPVEKPAPVPTDKLMLLLSHLCLPACIFLAAYKQTIHAPESSASGLPSIPGYTVQAMDDQTVKASNNEVLVYVKPIMGFYSTDHNPSICWQGSGFDFRHIREARIGEKRVYFAVLEKGGERLQTAWWYDNGAQQTVSQLEWRWDALRYRRQYALVNVTAADKRLLDKAVRSWLNKEENGIKRLWEL